MAKTLKKKARAKATPAPRERAAKPQAVAPRRGKLERVQMPAGNTKAARGGASAASRDAKESKDTHEGKYVYCIIKSGKATHFGALGIGTEPAEVHTVHRRRLYKRGFVIFGGVAVSFLRGFSTWLLSQTIISLACRYLRGKRNVYLPPLALATLGESVIGGHRRLNRKERA